jgi:hypothetical protein
MSPQSPVLHVEKLMLPPSPPAEELHTIRKQRSVSSDVASPVAVKTKDTGLMRYVIFWR